MSDIKLIVGVDEDASYRLFKEGVKRITTKLNKQNYKIKIDVDHENIKALRKEIQDVLSSMKSVSLAGVFDTNVFNTLTKDFDSAIRKAEKLKSTLSKAGNQDGVEYKTLEQKQKAYTEAYNRFKTKALSGGDTKAEVQELVAIRTEIDRYISSLEKKSNAEKASAASANKQLAELNKGRRLLNEINKASNNYTKAATGKTREDYKGISELSKRLKDATDLFVSGKLSIEEYSEAVKGIDNEFRGLTKNIKDAGEDTQSFGDKFKKIASVMTKWTSAAQMLQMLKRVMRDVAQEVRDIDAAMTELKKVTDATASQYAEFLDDATVRAKKLGATLVDTINASADMARLGYNLIDASALADTALVYKNVGDGISDIDEASSSIISTMQAFGVEAQNSMNIVDKFNTAGNKFAISSGGVGDALLNSASALAAAGNSLDDSIALITAANTTVQDPQKVGTALKTVSMYLRAAKTDAEAAGESTDGMAESVSKLRTEILQLTGGQVDIQIDENTFKSTTQILRELSQVWSTLSDVSQANILERIGGKRNSNVVAALLNNFELVDDVINETQRAAGSALAENEKYLDSINGKISQFQATFQDLSQSILNSELVKSIIDLGTIALNVIDSIADGVGGIFSAPVIGNVVKVMAPLLTIKHFFSNQIKSIVDILGQLGNKKASGGIFKIARLLLDIDDAGGGLSGTLSVLTKKIKGLLSTPLGKFTAAVATISLVAHVFNSLSQKAEKAREKLEDIKSEYESNKSELEKYNSELETTRQRMYELLKLDSLSYVEQDELDKLKKSNTELEREVNLLEAKNKLLKEEKALAFNDAARKDLNGALETFDGMSFIEKLEELGKFIISGGVFTFDKSSAIDRQITDYKSGLNSYNDTSKEYSEFVKKYNSATDDYEDFLKKKNVYESDLEYFKKAYNGEKSYLIEQALSAQSAISGIEYGLNETTDAYLDEYNDIIDKIYIALGYDDAEENAFSRLINETFDEVTDKFEDLGKDGKATVEDLRKAFDGDKTFADFIRKLIELGYISDDSDQSLSKIARAFNLLGDEASDAGDKIEDAFKRWEDAQNEVQSGAKFDTALEAYNHLYDTVADKTSEVYGRIGNEDYKAAFELIIPESAGIDPKNIEQVKKYLKANDLRTLFTFDENGDYKGIDFLDFYKRLEKSGFMELNKETGQWFLTGSASLKEMADSLGIAEPLLKAMFLEANEFGANFQFFETDDDLETLTRNAKSAAKAISEEFDDIKIELDFTKYTTDPIEYATNKINELISKRDKLNLETDSDAYMNINKLIEYYTRQKQLLEQPVVLNIDTTQITNSDALVLINNLRKFADLEDQIEFEANIGGDTTELEEELRTLGENIQKTLGENSELSTKFILNEDDKKLLEEDVSAFINKMSEETFINAGIGITPESFQPAMDAIETMATKIDEIFNGERVLTFDWQKEDGVWKLKINTEEVEKANEEAEDLGIKIVDINKNSNIKIETSSKTEKEIKTVKDFFKDLRDAANKTYKAVIEVAFKQSTEPGVENGSSGLPMVTTGNSILDEKLKPVVNKKFGEVNGTAHANGNWGFEGGEALVGELGQEIVVDPKTSSWYTVGDHGAEFVDIPKNAIIFNHRQTESLLKNGYVTGRGHALANGTALVTPVGGGTTPTYPSSDKLKNSKEDSSQIIDYIEILLSRLSRSLENFAKVTDDTSKSFKERNKALEKQIDKTDDLITANQDAADAYLKKANSISLSSGIKEKVRNGSYDITKYDSDTAEKINQYKEYYEKYLEAKDEVNNQKSNKAALTMEQFDLIQSKYDSKYGYHDSRLDYQEALNEKYELLGQGGSFAAQNNSIEIHEKRLSLLKEEQDEYKNLLNSGAVKKNTEDWYKLKEAIASNKAEILETENTIEELNQKKTEIKFDRFEKTREDYENKLSVDDNKVDYWEAVNNKAVAEGHGGSLTAQKEILAIHENRLSVLKEEKSELEAQLKKIPKETDEWYKAKNSVQELNQEIVNTNTELVETKKNIDSINFERFQNVSVDYANKNLKTEGALKKWEDINTTDELSGKHGSIKAQDKLLEWNGVYIESLNNELAEMEKKWAKIDKDSQEYADAEKAVREKRDQIRDAENQQLQYANNKRDILFSQYQDLQAEYDNKLGDIDHALSKVNHDIAMAEAKGYKVSKSFYEEQKSLEEERLSTIKQQYAEMKEKFEEAVEVGEIEEGSLEWYEYQKSLDAVEQSANDAELAIENLNQSIKDVDWENFKYLRDTIDELNDEADFYLELMSDEDMFDDKGNITEYGMASIGLRGQKYNTYMEEAAANSKKLKEIEEELAKDPANQKLIDQKKELTDAIYDNILAAKDQKQAMIDLVEDGINYELDALRDLIDEYKDALDKAKDLHDYEKKVNESTSEISSIKKQLSAYSGDDSQEAKLRIQKLQEDLKKAEEGLEETEYDRYISDQKELLDNFYDEYETNLNSRLDDIDVVINDLVGSVNQNAGTINDTLDGLANEFGIELSDDMKAIWGDSKFTDVIQSYVGENSVINKGQTAIISVLNNIANNVSKILEPSGESSGSNNSSFGSMVDEATSSSVGVNSPGIVNTLLDKFKPYQSVDTSSLEYSPGDVVRLSRTTPIYTDTDGNHSFDYYGNIYGGEDNDPKKYYVVDTYGEWVGISVRDDAKTPSYWVNSKDGKISKYKNGGLVDYTGLAWVDGSKSNPEYVLNANDTENLMKLTEDLRKIYSSRLNKSGLTQEVSDAIRLDSISSSIISDINKASSLLGNTIGDINITIPIERVQDYNDFVTQLKDDPKFDKLVKSLSLDLLDGKSRLAKNRINWNK